MRPSKFTISFATKGNCATASIDSRLLTAILFAITLTGCDIANSPYEPAIKVYLTERYLADYEIFITNYRYEADIEIEFVQYKYQSDFTGFIVDTKYRADKIVFIK